MSNRAAQNRFTLSVIIVTYNSSQVIERCLSNISSNSIEVIIVDNQSTDATVDLARATIPNAILVENDNNDGFAKAVRLGVLQSTADFILLLNPDCYINLANIDALLKTIKENSCIGVIGPKLTDGTNELPSITAGHFPTLWRMFAHMSGLARLAHGRRGLEGHYLFASDLENNVRGVDWVTGGCMLIRRQAWDSVGGMTTRWFMYAEDIEFCWRLKQAGIQVVIDPRVEAIHEIGGSSSDVDGRASTSWLINLYDFVCWRIYSSSFKRALWRTIVLCGFQARHLVLLASSTVLPSSRRSSIHRRSQLFRGYASAIWGMDKKKNSP